MLLDAPAAAADASTDEPAAPPPPADKVMVDGKEVRFLPLDLTWVLPFGRQAWGSCLVVPSLMYRVESLLQQQALRHHVAALGVRLAGASGGDPARAVGGTRDPATGPMVPAGAGPASCMQLPRLTPVPPPLLLGGSSSGVQLPGSCHGRGIVVPHAALALAAMTTQRAGEVFDLERIEWLGDCLLKVVTVNACLQVRTLALGGWGVGANVAACLPWLAPLLLQHTGCWKQPCTLSCPSASASANLTLTDTTACTAASSALSLIRALEAAVHAVVSVPQLWATCTAASLAPCMSPSRATRPPRRLPGRPKRRGGRAVHRQGHACLQRQPGTHR